MTRLVKVQIAIFVALTLIGVTYAGARYAGLADQLISDRTYHVNVDLPESGGIFEGAEVSYRGVGVGEVDELRLTPDGVRVRLAMRGGSEVPADTVAVVENRSAIGEQYVDLQPRSAGRPYLQDGSRVKPPDTRTPVRTTVLLRNLNRLVGSVDNDDLGVVVDELGKAFWGTGDDLGRIIDSGNSLIEAADKNLDQTVQLLRDGRVVLRTQQQSGGHIQDFSRDLADLSDTVVESDPQVRSILDEGVGTARQLNGLMSDLEGDLPVLLANLVTSGQVVRDRLDGLQQVLIVYPYVVRGGYSVIDKDPGTGNYTTHFGLQLALGPSSCQQGYGGTDRRPPERQGDTEANEDARCTEEDTNHRGAQNGPTPGEDAERGVPPGLGTDGPGSAGGLVPGADNGSAGGAVEGGPKSGSDGAGSAGSVGAGPLGGGSGPGGDVPATRATDGATTQVGSVVDPVPVRTGPGGVGPGRNGKESWQWLLAGPLTP